jgi:hypothetical protein
LYEINYSGGGVLRLTNSSGDITALSQTWTAVGAQLVHGAPEETTDRKAQGVELELYGIDQTITDAIQANNFRGHVLRIYLLHFDETTGAQDTPDLLFVGRQNGEWRVQETRDHSNQESGGAVSVRTRVTADLAQINAKVSTRSNVRSHEEMIRRSGVASPTDLFFFRVKSLANKEIWWGPTNPERSDYTSPRREPGGEGDAEVVW